MICRRFAIVAFVFLNFCSPLCAFGGSKPPPTPAPKPTATAIPNAGASSTAPSAACSQLSSYFTTIGQQIVDTATKTQDTIDRSDRTHYYALPFNFGSFQDVDRAYGLAISSANAASQTVGNTLAYLLKLDPQLNAAQRSASDNFVQTVNQALSGMTSTAQQGLILRRAVTPQNAGTVLQIVTALLSLGQNVTNKTYIGVLGSGAIQNFVTSRTNEGATAYATMTNATNSPWLQVQLVDKALGGFVDACSPDASPTIVVNPNPVRVNGSTSTTIIPSEIGYAGTFTATPADSGLLKLTNLTTNKAFDVSLVNTNSKGSSAVTVQDSSGRTATVQVFMNETPQVSAAGGIVVAPSGTIKLLGTAPINIIIYEVGFGGLFTVVSSTSDVSVSSISPTVYAVVSNDGSKTGTATLTITDNATNIATAPVSFAPAPAATPTPTTPPPH
jgi:hypothetical protein